MAALSHRRLGEIMVEEGWIQIEQVEEALTRQEISQERIGKILIQMGCIGEHELAVALAKQFDLAYIDLADVTFPRDITKYVSEILVKRYLVLAIRQESGRLILAMADPTDFMAIEDVRVFSGLDVVCVVTEASAIQKAIAELYGVKALSERVSYLFATPNLPIEDVSADSDAPVISIVNEVIAQAVRERASDIHIEPCEKGLRVRFRVDGVLRESFSFPLALHPAFVSRLKIMSALDIAEKRLPQDGRIQYIYQDSSIDLRVATMPTIVGEKVVLRILDCKEEMKNVEQLGLSAANLQAFRSLYRQPQGLILLTGKTGSGKTTTLYAVLAELNDDRKNVVTIENPVEYHLNGVNQIQVNPKIGLTFVTALRAVLRQDPNVIMVGEIRDEETANIAIKAALTGHVVLSTLHTQDALGAIVRLKDMGVKSFLLADTILGIVAQRLVRCVCKNCKMPYRPVVDSTEYQMISGRISGWSLYRGAGCKFCHGTGYYGRVAISEVLVLTPELRAGIVAEADTAKLYNILAAQGFASMYDDGLEKALDGITTLEEVVHAVH